MYTLMILSIGTCIGILITTLLTSGRNGELDAKVYRLENELANEKALNKKIDVEV